MGRHLLDILDKVAIDDIPVILSAVANFSSRQCEKLVIRCIEIVVESDIEVVTLEKSLPPNIAKKVLAGRQNLSLQGVEIPSPPGKNARKIHQALDSDDIDLLKMLLTEGHTSLDDAYALHHAVAHCDAEIIMELLDLGPLDVNRRNSRGYSVLHVAAMRREAKIIISLLTRGARPSDLTWDGRKPAQISKRLTKSVGYYMTTVDGNEKASPDEGRLCIGILEHAERRNPLMGEAFSLEMAGDDQRGRLLYLENRVALAKMLFPREAKVAMDIARVNGTMEFTLCTIENQRSTLDCNKAPNFEEYQDRIEALSKTVELGKGFFPRCSAVLDKIMDDDLTDYASLWNSASSEQMKTYLELHDIVNRAFSADKEKLGKSAVSSASSAKSVGRARKRSRVRV